MTATAIVVQQLLSPFPATPLTANSADLTFTALTVTEGDVFTCTGREVILIANGEGTNTLTISSADDEKGRSEDITSYSLAANDHAVFSQGLTNSQGWKNSSSQIKLTPSSANILCAVVRLPVGYPN
jgi:hypothetical protein